MDILLITSSAQHTTANPDVELDAQRLQAWLEALPLERLSDTVSRVYQTISPFNEMIVEDSHRIALLELYRVVLKRIVFRFDELRLMQTGLNRAKLSQLHDDIAWLCMGVATGYKIVVKNGYTHGANPKRDADLLLSIYRGIELLGMAVLYAQRTGTPPPPLTYLEINQLYMYAASHRAEEARITAAKLQTRCNTVSGIFKQLMLQIISRPAGVGAEHDGVFDRFTFLEQYAKECKLQPGEPRGPAPERYVIDVAADQHPHLCDGTAPAVSAAQNAYTFDAGPMLGVMRKRIQKLSKSNASYSVTEELNMLTSIVNNIAEHRS